MVSLKTKLGLIRWQSDQKNSYIEVNPLYKKLFMNILFLYKS